MPLIYIEEIKLDQMIPLIKGGHVQTKVASRTYYMKPLMAEANFVQWMTNFYVVLI